MRRCCVRSSKYYNSMALGVHVMMKLAMEDVTLTPYEKDSDDNNNSKICPHVCLLH